MPTIVLLKCAVKRVVEEKTGSEDHRVHLAENSAETATADHALRADETQAILRIDGGIAAAVTAVLPLKGVVVEVALGRTTMIGVEKESILGMIIADVGVEVIAVHVEAIEIIASDVATVVTNIVLEVVVEVMEETAAIILMSILSQKCM